MSSLFVIWFSGIKLRLPTLQAPMLVCVVYACAVCVCVLVCVRTCACTCMQKPEEDIRCPSVSAFCLTSFIRDISLNVKLFQQAANPSNLPVSDPLPQHRSNRHMQPYLFF